MENNILAKQIAALIESGAEVSLIERLLDEFEEKVRQDEKSDY